MPDIFGRVDQEFGGGLSADSMFMTFPESLGKEGGVGLLIQDVGIGYRQPVRRIFELGPGRDGKQLTYYIIGRPEGELDMGRIFGIAAVDAQFYETYGSPCKQNNITLSGQDGCSADQGQIDSFDLTLVGVLLNGFQLRATAEDMVVRERVTGMFVGMQLEEIVMPG